MGERPRPKRLSDSGELRPKRDQQQQMQAFSDPKEELDAKGLENVAYALKEFADTHTDYRSPREAAGKIGEMLTENERATFMADLTTAGLLQEAEQGGELGAEEVYDKPTKLGADDAGPQKPEERMTEEELLIGLEGFAPEEGGIPPRFEQAYKKLEDLRRAGLPRADQVALASRGLIDNDEFGRFKGFVQERDAAAQRAKTTSAPPKTEERAPRMSHRELIPLGTTLKKLTQALGSPKGHVEGIPYWVLEDGDAVMLGPAGDGISVPQRFGENGTRIIKGTTYQYKDGVFHKTTAEKARSELRAPQRIAKRERASAPVHTEFPTDPETESSEKKRSLEEGKKIFLRAIHKEKKVAGRAFRQAAEGLTSKDRKRLISFIADTTDIPRTVLETIDRDFGRESADKTENGERARARLEREIREDIDKIGSDSGAPERQREGRDRKESEAERIAREIEEDIASILAK